MRRRSLSSRFTATVSVLAALHRERRVPFLAAEQVRALRDARLRSLVRYAAAGVPHYRDLFREQGIDPREIASAEDLRQLPVLEKAAVQAEPDRFRPESREREAAVHFRTSGTTGTPVSIYQAPDALLLDLAVGERERAVVRQLVGKRSYATIDLVREGTHGHVTRAFYRAATLLPARPGHTRVSLDQGLKKVVATIEEMQPDVLAGFGVQVEWLFRLAAAQEIRFHLPRAVHYHSDELTDVGRELIEKRFGIPVVCTYGAAETHRTGFSCERRQGLHLHDDVIHVRIVRSDGTDTPTGENGEVLVSNLVNRGTVLLNYRLGDRATLMQDPCPCGRSFRRLAGLQGRTSDLIHLQDGSTVIAGSIASLLTSQDGVLRFQAVQRARSRFEVLVVMQNDASYSALLTQRIPALRTLLKGASVDVRRLATLEAPAGRKFERVVGLPRDDLEPGSL